MLNCGRNGVKMSKLNGNAASGDTGRKNILHGHAVMIVMTLLLCAMVALMWHIAVLANRYVGTLMRDGLDNDAQILDERVNGEIARLDSIGKLLSKTDEHTYNDYISLLRGLMASSDNKYRRMGIIAPNYVIYTTAGDPYPLEEADISIQELMDLHSGTYGLLSPAYTDKQDGTEIILFGVSLPSGGRVPGTLYAVMTMDDFVEAIMGDMLSRSLCVTEQSGATIYATASMLELTGGDNAESFQKALLSSTRDSFSTQQWNKYALTTTQLGFNGWILTELTPQSSIWDSEMFVSIGALAVNMALLIALIAVVSYKLFRRARGSENLVREAGIDRLTGINNILGFASSAKALLAHSNNQHYALIVMSTDAQEVLGPQFGYEAGRHILEDIARTLSAECESGELCARMDGSQFALLLRFSDTADIFLRIKALNSHIMTLCPMRVRMHYGIYVPNNQSEDLNQMLERASEVLRRVTRKGDMVGLYDDALHQKHMRDDALLNRAPGALTGGEFEVKYIPLRDINTMEVRGAEAVTFWRQPDGTSLAPSEYMPLLVRNAMTQPLNAYILEHVCSALCDEAKAGRTAGRVLISLSRESLVDGMLVPNLRKLSRQYGIKGERLEILISESLLTGDDGLMANVIKQLRDEGIRICVTDFGSGSTSLRIFGDMTVDSIRLSRRFIERSGSDERGRRMLVSLGKMAASFDTQIYAAGNFNHDQLELLKTCGCTRVERLHAGDTDNNFCALSEIKPDPAEQKYDPFDDWA